MNIVLNLPNDFGSAEDCAAMAAEGGDYFAIADAARAAGLVYIADTDFGAEWRGSKAQIRACVEALPAWARQYISMII